MRVLIDECLPRPLKSLLAGHDYRTVQEMGWDGVKNGELLLLAEKGFDVFLTGDNNLRYQQNLGGSRLPSSSCQRLTDRQSGNTSRPFKPG